MDIEGFHNEDEGCHIKDEGCCHIKDEGCCHIKDEGCHIEDEGCHIEDEGCHIEDEGCHIEDEGCHIEDEGCHIKDEGCHIKDEGCDIEDKGCHKDEPCNINCLYNVPYIPDIPELKKDFLKKLEKLSKVSKEYEEKTNEDSYDHTMIVYNAEEFLLAVFEAGCYNVVFSEEEKCKIVTLLLDAVTGIEMYVQFSCFKIFNRLEGYILQSRSAIEFLPELCKSSEQCKDFNEVLETLKECADLLNDVIDSSRKLRDYVMGPCNLKMFGASNVPKTHTWWAK